MRTCLECLPCIVKQTWTGLGRVVADPRRQEAAMREVLTMLASHPWQVSPPHLVQLIQPIIKRWGAAGDPYREAKQMYNKIALTLLDELAAQVRRAEDPFALAARLAIAGNIIDLGIVPDLNPEKLLATIERAKDEPFAVNDLEALRAAAAEAQNILYLGDNAGEIVLDQLLLSQLPLERVTYAVRGLPILNDATMEDAEATGLTSLVHVIGNGSDAPGTILGLCSPEFQQAFALADLIIAKGQGNYETLNDHPHVNLFFLLKVKCPIVSASLGAPLGGLIVKRSAAPAPAMGASA